ncbi:MAG: hypothetical protein MZV70_58740 [Desulfobacterales bacterium]|nr:hypothetical protein [Desulfobacterales bacterium]
MTREGGPHGRHDRRRCAGPRAVLRPLHRHGRSAGRSGQVSVAVLQQELQGGAAAPRTPIVYLDQPYRALRGPGSSRARWSTRVRPGHPHRDRSESPRPSYLINRQLRSIPLLQDGYLRHHGRQGAEHQGRTLSRRR